MREKNCSSNVKWTNLGRHNIARNARHACQTLPAQDFRLEFWKFFFSCFSTSFSIDKTLTVV